MTDAAATTETGNADLGVALAALLLADAAVFLPVVSESPLRLALVLPVLLLVPGYAVVAALFPEDRGLPSARPADDPRLGLLGRVVLSVGASVGVVAAVALTLDFTVFGFQLVPLLAGVTVLTVAATAAAWARRRAVPAPRQAAPTEDAVAGAKAFLVGGSRRDRALSALLVVSLVVAAGAVYAAPSEGEGELSVSLLAESNGTLAADDYPTELVVGEPTTLFLAVDNGAPEPTTATVVVRLQSVAVEGTDVTVTSQRVLDRYTVQVPGNTTEIVERAVTPDRTGERLRLAYHVYRGAAPEGTGPEEADRSVHLWVTVRTAT